MRGDALVNRQRMMAQSVYALADHLTNSTCVAVQPIKVSQLPPNPQPGWIACVSDSTVTGWGSVIAGSGTHTVLVWYNGANWTVIGQ